MNWKTTTTTTPITSTRANSQAKEIKTEKEADEILKTRSDETVLAFDWTANRK